MKNDKKKIEIKSYEHLLNENIILKQNLQDAYLKLKNIKYRKKTKKK